MPLTLKRFTLSIFSLFFSVALGAQTLYWVGGSGNFNDQNHWSLTSGGASAKQVPNSNTDVVFDDNSGKTLLEVQLGHFNQTKGFFTYNTNLLLRINGAITSTLSIAGSVRISPKTDLRSQSLIYFNTSDPEEQSIDLSNAKPRSDVFFNKGKFRILPLFLLESKKVSFGIGTYILEDTYLWAGSIVNETSGAKFLIKDSYFKANNLIRIKSDQINQIENLNITANLDSPADVDIPLGFISSKGFSSNNVNALCPVTISVSPSCSGPCTGVLTISLAPTCTTTPYSVQVTNANALCTAFATALSNTNIPSVYTVTNACACSGNNYIVVVRDGSNQIQVATNTVNFTPNSAVIFDGNISPTCSYLCDGTLTGLIIGSSPFTVAVSPGTLTPSSFTSAFGSYSISNACAGNYTFNITDVFGCVASIPNTLFGPAALQSNAVTTSISCNGFSSGAYSISPSGGTPGYTINFSAGSTPLATTGAGGTVSTNGLGVGAITATITDANSCTLIANSSITQPLTPFSVTPSQTNVACNGGATGAAAVLVSGATPSYAFSWAPVAGSSSSLGGLTAGTKTVTITDANSCTTSATFTITEPPLLTLTPSHTDIVCNGLNTGVAAVAASGGTGAITFTWVAPGPSTISTGAVNSFTNLGAGTYTIFASDANLCTTSVAITLTQSPSFTISSISQSISCLGLNDGSATVNIAGGNGAPYSFTWTAPGPVAIGNTSVVTNLSQGTHTVTVVDAAGCSTSTTAIIIQPATSVTPISSFTNLTCNAANVLPCNGVITASPSGGIPPYQYTLSILGSTLVSPGFTPPYNNLCVGSYTLDIKDASGCPQNTVIALSQPPVMVANLTVTPISCFGATTSIIALASGGNGAPFTYTWVTPPPTNTASGASLTNQIAGNYTLTATDASNCAVQVTTLVTQPSSISIAVNTPSISCFNLCNAAFSSTVSGGSGIYTYTWTNALSVVVSNAASPAGMCPGNYTVTVADGPTCSRTQTAVVLSPSPILLTQSTTPVNCFGDSNGSATITASGGTPGIPSYTFSVNFPTPVTNNTGNFSGQPAGSYTATVLDAAGCTQTISFTIGTPSALTASITGAVGSCNANNGSATVTASGGNVGAYSYTWTPSGGSASVAISMAPGNYSVTVADTKGCNVTVTTNIAFIVNININPLGGGGILCNGDLTGQATVTHTGGTSPYNYTWAAVGAPTLTTQTVITLSGSIVYTVTVRDANLCSNSATLMLAQPPAVTISTSPTSVTCFGFNNGAISTTLTGGTGALSPTWSPGGQLTASIASLVAGTYTLNVRDINLCPSSVAVTVTQPTSITITFTSSNPTGCAAPNGNICITTVTGGSGAGYTYTWSPPGGTTACLSGLPGGSYNGTVTDGAGCTNTITTTLVNASGPTLTAISSSVSCFGASTGAATVTAAGQNPFTFTWSPVPGAITPIPNGNTASGLNSQTYIVTCSDNFGCVTSTSIPIAQPSSVTINSSSVNLSCHSVSTGSISVAPTGGSPTYTFSWLPAASVSVGQGQGTGTVSSLAAGPYTLNLTDSKNCLTVYTFSLTQPSAFTITATTSSLLCNNVCTGSIVTNASGGTGAISYSWVPAGLTGSNTPTVTGLCANGTGTVPASYSLTITDANTCTLLSTYTVTQPAALTSTISLLNASCSNSCNAIATHSANGGVPAYTFSWSSSGATTPSVGALCSGSVYVGTAIDANGCSSVQSFTVAPVTPLTVTLTPINPLCSNSCNGSITTTVSGAQGAVTYSWSNAATSSSLSALCATASPFYTLVATDANSCQATSVTSFTIPAPLLASISGTNPICNGATNGSAAVSLTNAVGATSFTWLPTGPPTQTAQTATSLSANVVYTVFVSDNNACAAQQTVSLSDPPIFNIVTSVATTSCGSSNASITVNASGGTPGVPIPYSYTWSPAGITVPQGQGTATVINLAAGAYSVLIVDGAGCSTLVPIAVANSNGPVLPAIISTSVSCNLGSNGTASLDPAGISGGTPGYTVSWGPAPSYTNLTNPITNLAAGFYQARVIDNSGCISFTNITLAEPPPISNNPVINFPLCQGICDGSVSLNTTGGLAPYTFNWSPVLPNSSTVTSLCAGDYTVIVGYNGICTDTTILSLPFQTSITIVPTVTNNSCFGDCNASAAITVTGGTLPYVSSWSNSQIGSLATNLCNNVYTVSVTDANGCNNTAVATVTSGAQITTSTSVASPSCGFSNGSATVSASGGISPFTYSWTTSANTPIVSNLSAGIYVVVITDNALCSQSQTVIINNSNGITGETFNTQQIPCSGFCTGATTITPIGGNPPISFNWLNPASTNSVINGLCSGTYFVQMTDAQNCIRIASVTLNPLVTLTVSPFVSPPGCSSNNGSITVSVNGGTSPYSYTWTPGGNNTASLSNVGAGTYSLLVVESSTNNCSVPLTFNLSNPNGPVVTASQTNIACFSGSTGIVTTTATGSGVITYAWSTAATSASLSNLPAGVITLTVTSTTSVACQTIQNFTILQNPQLLLGVSNQLNSLCSGDCDGSITLHPLGGVLPYSFVWSAPNSNTVNTGNPFTNLCDGVYTSTLTDMVGCQLISPSYSIISQSSMSITANTFNSSCSSVADGSLSILATGGVPTYSYSWQGPASFTSTTATLNNVLSGTYTYSVIDNLNCTKGGTLTVVPTITVVAEAGSDTLSCPGTGTVVLSGVNSSGAQTYNWYKLPGNGSSLATTANFSVVNLSDPTLYLLVVTSSVATCFDADSVFIDIYSTPLVNAGTSTAIPVYTSYTLNPTVTPNGDPGPFLYSWSPPNYLTNPNDLNPIASNTINITYTLTVTDSRGCLASDTMQVLITPEIRFSNAFSPNADGKNDFWVIDYLEQFPQSTIEIYNRWGELLLSKKAEAYVNEPFDGRYKGKDLPVGSYYYIINLLHPTNSEYTRQFTGPLTIFR